MTGGAPNVLVRPAEADDAETLARFNEAMAWETENVRLDAGSVRRGVQRVMRDSSKGRYLVAEATNAVVGGLLLTFEWSDWRDGEFLWIQSVYVLPAYRRRGVFTALYKYVEALCRREEYYGIRLYVNRGNQSAIRTYERLGMVNHDYLVMETPDRLREDGDARSV